MSVKGDLLYEGKGKKVYSVKGDSDQVILFFKDDITANQGRKKDSFPEKGDICKSISSLIFRYLKKEKIPVHWIEDINSSESLCLKVDIIPLEVVLRNRLAGSTAKRLGLEEGSSIKDSPLLEFYYKRDDLDDPFISEEQIVHLSLIEDVSLLKKIKEQALLINKKLKEFFLKSGIELIDFKIEFGVFKGEVILSDDISPDSCRLWDKETGYRLDKDRFRRGWGDVEQGYRSIQERLLKEWGHLLEGEA